MYDVSWRPGRLLAISTVALLALAAACANGGGDGGRGGSGGSGAAGSGGGGGSGGSGGTGGGAAGMTGADAASPGGAGSGGSGGSGGTAGTGGPADGAAGNGGAGAGGAIDGGRAGDGAGVDLGGGGAGRDGGTGAAPATALLFTRATGFVHDSIGPAAMALRRVLGTAGVTAEISNDPALFAPATLARFGVVVMISTTGRPLGDPGTAAVEALAAYVRGGRGLVGVHAASNGHEDNDTYVSLMGGDFREHPGNVRAARCYPETSHPAVARLPMSFEITDEFYLFNKYRMDNLVVLRCDAFQSAQKLPIAWHRQEGAGRVFYTGLGHATEEWSDRRVLDDHVIPGILWALGR
jgi:uncharacterized protein